MKLNKSYLERIIKEETLNELGFEAGESFEEEPIMDEFENPQLTMATMALRDIIHEITMIGSGDINVFSEGLDAIREIAESALEGLEE